MITKALLYCTKNKPALFYSVLDRNYMIGKDKPMCRFPNRLNGHVVAVCDIEVEEINRLPIPFNHESTIIDYSTDTIDDMDELLKLSCLSYEKLDSYLEYKGCRSGYAIHIKNLKVFDEPMELGTDEYHAIVGRCLSLPKKAPQNMCSVSVYNLVNGVYISMPSYTLISIQPQWLVKILNGEKTIEVRKKVLRDMLNEQK